MIKISQGGQRHAAIIRDIALHTWPYAFKDILSVDQITYMLQKMYNLETLKQLWKDGHHYLLAKDRGFFTGFLTMEHMLKGMVPVTKIHRLYVLPEAQGRGIGLALLQAAEEAAAKEGSAELTLNVNRYNKAKDFYEKYGFTIVGEEDIDIGDGYLMEDYIMSKSLLSQR